MKKYFIEPQFSGYPERLPYSGTQEEVIKSAIADLTTDNTRRDVKRILSEDEIQGHRDAYTNIMEVDEIQLLAQIEELENQLELTKEALKSRKAQHASMRTEIRDHVMAIDTGYVIESLIEFDSIALSFDNKRLHYTYDGEGLVLALVEDCPPSTGNLFESQLHNQERFLEMFGIESSPECNFEQIDTKDAVGRKIATSVLKDYSEEQVNEETGEVVEIPAVRLLFDNNHILVEEDVDLLIEENIPKLIVYAKTSEKEGAEK